MAKLSFLKSMGASVYTNKRGELIIRRIGIDAKRIKTDPAYQRTRENGAHFGRAATAGKLIRHAFKPWFQKMHTSTLTGRLVKVLMTVLHSNKTNDRAAFSVIDGDLKLLEDFECNDERPCHGPANPFVFQFLEEKKQVKLKMKSFSNAFLGALPAAADGVKIIPVLVAVSIEENSFEVFAPSESKPVRLNTRRVPATEILADITLQTPFIMIAALSVEFCQTTNGENYPVAPAENMLRFINVFRG